MKKVKEFHEAFDAENFDWSNLKDSVGVFYTTLISTLGENLKESAHEEGSVALLRIHLLQEELGELCEAIEERDKVATLDALVDLQYVLDGAILAFGFEGVFEEAFEEVHRSNMSKLEDGKPVFDEYGRIAKGRDYSPPKLERFCSDE